MDLNKTHCEISRKLDSLLTDEKRSVVLYVSFSVRETRGLRLCHHLTVRVFTTVNSLLIILPLFYPRSKGPRLSFPQVRQNPIPTSILTLSETSPLPTPPIDTDTSSFTTVNDTVSARLTSSQTEGKKDTNGHQKHQSSGSLTPNLFFQTRLHYGH